MENTFNNQTGSVTDTNISNLDQSIASKELTKKETSSIVNKFFSTITCGDKEIENLLYEVIGYSITEAKTSKLCKSFIFKGCGRNGKSKIFRIIESLLKHDQCSHEHLENLSGSKAGSKSTVKKLENTYVNISEDQKQPKYINTSLITRIISGETISVAGEDITPHCVLLFSVNDVINFKETGLHITDRFVVINFNAVFTDSNNNRDINIEEKLCSEQSLELISSRAKEAFNKVLNQGKFTIPESVIESTKQYFLECNNVAEFCGLYPVKTIIVKSRYYQEYRNWCTYNNREAVSNNVFGREVLALGYRAERYSFRNDRKTYYAAPDFDNNRSQNVFNEYISKSGLGKDSIAAYTDKELDEYFKVKSFDDFLSEKLNCTTSTDN